MTIVLVDHTCIGRAEIGRRSRFSGPFPLETRDGARIGSQNDVLCGDWTASPQFQHVGYERHCRLGAGSLITDHHVIDGGEAGGGPGE